MRSDVRRATLANLPINPRTIPAMLARTRDVDPVVRKLVYTSVLEPHCTTSSPSPSSSAAAENEQAMEEMMGPTHPRVFSIEQRELVVRNGLGDREEGVKAAASKLVSTWLDVVRVGTTRGEKDKEGGEKDKEKESVDVEGDIVAFLELFDLVENSTAEDALTCIFKSRNDILDALKLDGTCISHHILQISLNKVYLESFWDTPTPEKTFLARVFVDHCITTKDTTRLEEALPVVTMLAFRIQGVWGELIGAMQAEEEELLLRGGMINDEGEGENEGRARREEERADMEFVVGEMLRMAVSLDYADEIGRRKMFQLVRECFLLPSSPIAVWF